jgi:cytochrome b
MQRFLIWDLPTRLFHWTLSLSFAAAWLTSESDPWLAVHVFVGYLMLGLVGFRLLWGVIGSPYARFRSFWFGPRAALAYLRQVLHGQAERHIGHNPAGSLAIYALLLLTVVIGVTGILTLGGEEQHGLAAGWLSVAQGGQMKALHEAAAIGMLLLVLGHIAGVLVESYLHRENLARSMLTGYKLAATTPPLTRPRAGVAAVMLGLILVFATWWFWPADQRLAPNLAFTGPQLADNAQWREECGSCHLAFHPSLLPARAWTRLLAGQAQHFGSDLALDEPTRQALQDFLAANAAERQQTEAAVKILQSLAPGERPLRITDTDYWVRKHREITPAQWAQSSIQSKANCAACHQDAQAGTFEDGAMRIPPP